MNATRDEKKAEALARMKLWRIHAPIITAFENKDKVAESTPPFGACFWLNDEQKKRVRKFEESHHGALVYHVIHHKAIFGGTDEFELEEYLYVSDFPEEWETDRADIAEGMQIVYSNNLTAPDCSELGSIGIKRTPAAGLARVW